MRRIILKNRVTFSIITAAWMPHGLVRQDDALCFLGGHPFSYVLLVLRLLFSSDTGADQSGLLVAIRQFLESLLDGFSGTSTLFSQLFLAFLPRESQVAASSCVTLIAVAMAAEAMARSAGIIHRVMTFAAVAAPTPSFSMTSTSSLIVFLSLSKTFLPRRSVGIAEPSTQ